MKRESVEIKGKLSEFARDYRMSGSDHEKFRLNDYAALYILRVAPEQMDKYGLYYELTKKEGLKQFLTYYVVAAHPGCTMDDMERLRAFAVRDLGIIPKQVQVFTPTPSTYATLMYWTERDPFTGERIFVEKSVRGREEQKEMLSSSTWPSGNAH